MDLHLNLQSSSSTTTHTDSSSSNTPDPSGVSQTIALIILTLLFLWIAIIGSSRILKVLDRRHFLIGAAQARTRWNNLYGPGSLHNNNNTNINENNDHSLTTPLRGSHVGGGGVIRHASSSGSQQRYGTATSANGGSGGVLGSSFTENILCDNRFVFGFFAIILGVCRAAYVISFMFLSGGNGGVISGDNVTADTVTAPLAWFFFSLLSAVLWTLRDLLDRVNLLLNPNGNNNQQHLGTSSPNSVRGLEDDEDSNGNALSRNTTPSSNVRPVAGTTATVPRVGTAGSDAISNYSMATRKGAATLRNSGESCEEIVGSGEDSTVLAPSDEKEKEKENSTTTVDVRNSQESAANSEDEPAVPVRRTNSITGNNNNSTPSKQIKKSNEDENGRRLSVDDDANGTTTSSLVCCSIMDEDTYKKYRSLLTIFFMLIIILVSLLFSWIEQNHDSNSKLNKVVPAAISSAVCFALFFWGVACSYESILLLRQVGMVAHRVAIAIIVMSIFLFIRGLLILPPFQEHLCGGGDGESQDFWSCTFLYNFVDCAGIALILQILP